MSKQSDEQTTPKWLFDSLDSIFKFNLDVAATKENALCPMFYDQHMNGLERRWDLSTWCNPPYSRGQVFQWVTKASEEYEWHQCSSLLLLLGDTSTKWFNKAHTTCTAMYALGKRLKFNGAKDCAKFGSIFVLYGYNKTKFKALEKTHHGVWLKKYE
jgi:site-specific DNA-methyltransferase (adenine-specific)